MPRPDQALGIAARRATPQPAESALAPAALLATFLPLLRHSHAGTRLAAATATAALGARGVSVLLQVLHGTHPGHGAAAGVGGDGSRAIGGAIDAAGRAAALRGLGAAGPAAGLRSVVLAWRSALASCELPVSRAAEEVLVGWGAALLRRALDAMASSERITTTAIATEAVGLARSRGARACLPLSSESDVAVPGGMGSLSCADGPAWQRLHSLEAAEVAAAAVCVIERALGP